MMLSLRMRCMPIAAVCAVLIFCFPLNVYASPGLNVFQPEILQMFLSVAGLETEIVDLNRGDGFERGIYIEGIQDVTLLIGFPKTGITKGTPFLLSVEGVELLVELSEEEGLIVIDGDEELIPLNIFDFVECILESIIDVVQGILSCGANPFCIVIVALSGVFKILGCIFYIL